MATIQVILNDFHRAVLRDFDDGVYASLAEQDVIEDLEGTIGDLLLIHIMIELSKVTDVDHAIRCVGSELEDLTAIMRVLEAIQEEIDTRTGVACCA